MGDFLCKGFFPGVVVVVTTKFRDDIEMGDIGVVCGGKGINIGLNLYDPQAIMVYMGEGKIVIAYEHCLEKIDEIWTEGTISYSGWNPYEEDLIEKRKERDLRGKKALEQIFSQCPVHKK